MAQMPDIKPEVNKEPEKKRGMLAGLFGGGGGTGAAGMGGSAATGGLLATKTGLLTLVLVGTTVAGGVGVVGYKLFGPGDTDQPSQNIQLFAARPKDAAPSPNAAPAAAQDGNSASLEGFAKVNSGAMKGETPAAPEAPKDEAADNAASAGSSASNAVMGASGSGASRTMLKTDKKFGALGSSLGSGGSGSSASSGGSRAGDMTALAAAGKGGQLGAMSNSRGAAAATASGARGIGARARRTGAQAQARFARDMGQQNTASMRVAGKGFGDTAANAGSDNIGDPNAIAMGGLGAGTGAQPQSIPASPIPKPNEVKPPDPPKMYDVTPYAKEMATAQMLLMLACALLYAASAVAKMKKAPFGWTLAVMVEYLLYAAMAAGAAVVVIGLQIAGGKYGQGAQGDILLLAGAGVTAAAALARWGDDSLKVGGEMSSSVMFLGGAAAAIAMMGPMLMKPKTCKSKEPDNPDKCTMIQKAHGYPSERALQDYLT